ncbi:MAG: ATP-dependent Clp protease proteolytic subunit [Burkholderiales bacterium]
MQRAAKRGACPFVFPSYERLIADAGWQVPAHLREARFERGVPLRPDLPGAIEMEVNEEKPEAPERVETLADRLAFKSRFVMLFGEINHAVARATCTRLIALAEDSDAPITVLISSPGGHVESGDSIHDIIRFVRAPVTTVGTGWVASAGTHVFLAAPGERRLCLPNTRFMIHQPGGGAGGPATDIAIQAKEILRTRERIAKVISKETGQSLQKVLNDMERDFWMSAEEAIAYGLVSKIIETSRQLG